MDEAPRVNNPNGLDPAWKDILTKIAGKGYQYWKQLLNGSWRQVYEAIYDLYNYKIPENTPLSSNYTDDISNVFAKLNLTKNAQGPFYVCYNFNLTDPNWDTEWRVYVNAKTSSAALVFEKLLGLMNNPNYRILQLKINKEYDGAKCRSDVIVVYADSENGAAQLARYLGGDPVIQGHLNREVVMTSRCICDGVGIGESPIARTGKAESMISFGDLRAAVLTCAVIGMCYQVEQSKVVRYANVYEALTFWLNENLDNFGLSTQESFRNGNISNQPTKKSDMEVRIENFEKLIKNMTSHL
jgi:hypothetical protein